MKTWVKVLLVAIVLTLVGAIGWFLYMGMQSKQPVELVEDQKNLGEVPVGDLDTTMWQDLADENLVIDSGAVMPNNLNVDEADLVNKAKVEQVSSSFVEVFGSYSTDSDYQNLFDLEEMVTDSYWGQLERYIDSDEKADDYSIWTNTLKANVANLSDDSAEVLVKTQRGERESKQSLEKIFYQDAEVFLLKEAGLWLVNKVTWLEE